MTARLAELVARVRDRPSAHIHEDDHDEYNWRPYALTDAECESMLRAEFLRIADRLETVAASPYGNAETERVLRHEAARIRKEFGTDGEGGQE
jgi:hypothetical protein